MTVMQIKKMDAASLAPEEYFLASDKLILGNPKQTIWPHYTDPSAKFLTGIWQSEIGKWRIHYTEEEFCQMLQGVSVVTGADGKAVTLKAGDNFVIPRGFQGTWEVLELSRKIYVIYEA